MIKLKIDKILDEKGKTRYWLSKQCNISPNNMSKICNNDTRSISFDILEKICKTLDCTPNDIIESDDPQLERLLSYKVLLKTCSHIEKSDT